MDGDLTAYERVAMGLPPSKLKPMVTYVMLALQEWIWSLNGEIND